MFEWLEDTLESSDLDMSLSLRGELKTSGDGNSMDFLCEGFVLLRQSSSLFLDDLTLPESVRGDIDDRSKLGDLKVNSTRFPDMLSLPCLVATLVVSLSLGQGTFDLSTPLVVFHNSNL